MVKFLYKIKGDLLPLIRSSIADYTSDYFTGYMDEGDANNLRHCNLYLVCDYIDGVYLNPISIVAKNEYVAIGMFSEITSSNNSTVVCALENRCDTLVVEPIEE